MARIKIEDLADDFELNQKEMAHFRGGLVKAIAVQPIATLANEQSTGSATEQTISNVLKSTSDLQAAIIKNLK